MIDRRVKAWAVLVILLASPAGRTAEEESSPWAVEPHVRARLVAGAAAGGTGRWAALEMVLDPGFKTYWRDPGESGLPPVFAWQGSTNLDGVETMWPAPARLEDAAGTANGYIGRLVLPFRITPHALGQVVGLALQADLGICHDICIPVRLKLTLALGEIAEQPEAIAEALEHVPKPQSVATPGPLSILSVRRREGSAKPMLEVTVRAPIASAPQLFVEAPPNWFLAVSDPIRPDSSQTDTRLFQVEIAERPREVAGPVPLTITLTAEEAAIESAVTLDAAMLAR